MDRNQPQNPWARYADGGVVYSRSQREAEKLHDRLKQRFKECGLELHPDRTRIVYCVDDNRSEKHSLYALNATPKFTLVNMTLRGQNLLLDKNKLSILLLLNG